MYFHWIDWVIVVGLMAFITIMALYTKRYTRSVADFLAANRTAGRYMLSIAGGIAGLGAITVVANFQMFYDAGFVPTWWEMMRLPVGLIIALSGYVIYRYRETRAMTLAQFFEMRYSRNFRIFAGIVAFLAGIVNYGIFPAVTANFFIYFCGLPEYFSLFGLQVETFPVIMAVELSIALFFTFSGGQIAVMVTDFMQGMFCNVAFLLVLTFIFFKYDWSDMMQVLSTAPEGKSLIHPMKASGIPDFNYLFYVIGLAMSFYTVMAWQGSQGYQCSAKNAHEAKMASVLGTWRGMTQALLLMLLPIAVWYLLHSPETTQFAQDVNARLDLVANEQVRHQMTVPLALSKMLPIGLTGLFCAVMVAAAISTDDTYLHSWGSIFIQDVILPFRKKPLSPKQHMFLLRAAILGVAIFGFSWSYLFRQTEHILLFFAITGAIYAGGAGSAIVGGLYWKRGTTAGAWVAMITGSTVAVGGILVQQFWPSVYAFLASDMPGFLDMITRTMHAISGAVPGINWEMNPDKFPINGMFVSFFSMILAVSLYVSISLLTCKTPVNLDKLLHRGKYAIADDSAQGKTIKKPARGWKALGIGSEFTAWDKVIYLGTMFVSVGWFTVFVVGTIYNFNFDVSDAAWETFWHFKVWYGFILGVFTTVWFFFGGIRDMRDMFTSLRTMVRDHQDDGSVAHEEEAVVPMPEMVEPVAEVVQASSEAVDIASDEEGTSEPRQTTP